jgi:DNA-binding GntR family transcriptional regulator
VREALARLHAEELVERHPEGGFRPSPPDLRRTHELYQVRFALEHHALRLPAESGRTHDLAALEALHDEWAELARADDRPVEPTFVLLDEDFHVRLAASAGNEALVDTLVGVNERIRPVRMHDFLTAERVEATVRQHLTIVDGLLAGDVDAAEARLRHHLGQSLSVVEERAAAALTRMLGGSAMTDPHPSSTAGRTP